MVSEDKKKINTTVDAEVFDTFKEACQKQGIPMNTVLEACMRTYVDGDIYLKITKKAIPLIGFETKFETLLREIKELSEKQNNK